MPRVAGLFFLFAAASVITPFRAGAIQWPDASLLIAWRLHQFEKLSKLLPATIIANDEYVGGEAVFPEQMSDGISGFDVVSMHYHHCLIQFVYGYGHATTLAQLAHARSAART